MGRTLPITASWYHGKEVEIKCSPLVGLRSPRCNKRKEAVLRMQKHIPETHFITFITGRLSVWWFVGGMLPRYVFFPPYNYHYTGVDLALIAFPLVVFFLFCTCTDYSIVLIREKRSKQQQKAAWFFVLYHGSKLKSNKSGLSVLWTGIGCRF